MKRFALPVFCLLFAASPLQAQSDEMLKGVQQMMTHLQQGNYTELRPLSEKLLGLAQKEFAPTDPINGLIYYFHGASLAATGADSEAEVSLNRALDLLRNSSEFGMFVPFVYQSFGQLYSKRSQYPRAEEFLQKSLSMFEKIGGKNENYALPLNDLGLLYKMQGEYGKSEKFLTEAAEIRKRTLGEGHFNYGVSLNNLASLYEELGNWKDAVIYYERAIRIWRNSLGEAHPLIATALNNYAGIYLDVGMYGDAEKLYKNALAINAKAMGEKNEPYITSLSNLGNLYLRVNRLSEAEAVLTKAMQLCQEVLGEKHEQFAYVANNLGIAKMHQRKYDEAEKLIATAHQLFKAIFGRNHRQVARCSYNLGVISSANGNQAKAAEHFKQGLAIHLDRIDYVFPAINDKEKTLFYETIQEDFEFFNFFTSQNYKTNPGLVSDMYNYTLATKALLLNASNKIKRRILSSGDATLIALYDNWKARKNRLAQVWQMSEAEKYANRVDEIAMEAEVNQLEKQLSEKSELFAQVNDRKRYTWRDIQRKLKPDEAAIEIVRFARYNKVWTDTSYYAALIIRPGASAPEYVFMETGTQLETKSLSLYKNSIRLKIADTKSYAAYWGAIGSKLVGVRKVYLSPDGVFNQISLNSLHNPATNKFLMDELEVQQVTNTKDLLALPRNSKVANATMVGFPDYITLPDQPSREDEQNFELPDSLKREFENTITPLPGTLKEVNIIADIMRKHQVQSQVFTGTSASEGMIKNVQSPSILHIATHGFFLSDIQKQSDNARGTLLGLNAEKVTENPLLRSGILLAGVQHAIAGKNTNADDGILTAYEAMNLNLDNTELVVLSACETGLGEVRNGEGVYGFQRALIIAGAGSVVMSLWKVSDEATQQLMSQFYQFWMSGNPKRQAFLMAQQKIREIHPEPYFWAPFVLIGE